MKFASAEERLSPCLLAIMNLKDDDVIVSLLKSPTKAIELKYVPELHALVCRSSLLPNWKNIGYQTPRPISAPAIDISVSIAVIDSSRGTVRAIRVRPV